jgi:S-adenosylhomocysteine hydrolase
MKEKNPKATLLEAPFVCRIMARKQKELTKRAYRVPEHIYREIAKQKLGSMNVEIDILTPEQGKYPSS